MIWGQTCAADAIKIVFFCYLEGCSENINLRLKQEFKTTHMCGVYWNVTLQYYFGVRTKDYNLRPPLVFKTTRVCGGCYEDF